MKLSTTTLSLEKITCDACIIFTHGRIPLLKTDSGALKKEIQQRLKNHSFSGKTNECIKLETSLLKAKHILLVGCGKDHIEPKNIEQAISSAIRAGISAGCRHFSILDEIPKLNLATATYQLLLGRGAIWGSYQYLLGKSNPKPTPLLRLTYVGNNSNKNSISNAKKQGDILKRTADLANSPGNIATPKQIAAFAKSLATSTQLTVQTLGKKELEKIGFGGMLAVSQGSSNDPSMIILKHNPKKSKKSPIVLIGKTVTFDSGGISLKPGKNMGWMRYDKCGGMSILATMQMLDAMQTDLPVIGILGAAENMPDASATRPGDIIKMHDGKTVEVLNTDAEDRVRAILKIAQQPISLQSPIGDSEDTHFGDFIEDKAAEKPDEVTAFSLLKEKISDVLLTLTDREQEVLTLRFGLVDGYPRTLEEVGRKFNVTRERIRQIEAKALRKMRHPTRIRKLEGFLDGE